MANTETQNDRIALFKVLTFDSEPVEELTRHQKVIRIFAEHILRPENQHLITDEFLATIQLLDTVEALFDFFLAFKIAPTQEMVQSMEQQISNFFWSSTRNQIRQWIESNPPVVPVRELTLEEKFAQLETQIAESETLLANTLEEVGVLKQDVENARAEKLEAKLKYNTLVTELNVLVRGI